MVEIKQVKRALVVVLPNEIDERSCVNLRGCVDSAIAHSVFDRLIFDFTHVTFMDSAGIGMLIGRYKLLSRYCKPCYLTGVRSHISKILELSGIYNIIPMVDIKEVM